ncbi:hypothetical protein ABBQ38_011160 [Trebouxia sp. C0009 RCD-2024]
MVAQHNALPLTPELWAKVFSHLEERPQTVTIHDTKQLETQADLGHRQNQKEVHRIKLVCKQFRKVHASHPGHVQRLYLSRGFSHRSLTSLLAWLQRNKSTVKTCQSMCRSPLVNAVLAGLVSLKPCLTDLHVCSINSCSISIIAAFTGLERCVLRYKKEERLDLESLGSLPKLKHLVLDGDFRELQHLAGLTHLECIEAGVSGIQAFKCASILQFLEVHHSCLSEFQTQGLSICTALTQLVWSDSSLTDHHDHLYLDSNMNQVPAKIALLTRLHTLHLTTGDGEKAANLEWISNLTSLHALSVSFGISYGQVAQHALPLTNLTQLSIQGLPYSLDEPFAAMAGNEVDPVYVLNIDVGWHRLQALQELFLCDCKLKLGSGVAGLFQLHRLRHISFAGSTIHDGKDHECFAALLYNLARLCPHVKLVAGAGDLSSYFAQ